MDVAAANNSANTFAVYNPPESITSTWTSNILSDSAAGATKVWIADMNSDGQMDVVAASYDIDSITVYLSQPSPTPPMAYVVTDESTSAADGVRDIYVADINKDGVLDILAVSELNNKVAAWIQSTTIDLFFTENVISTSANGPLSISVADLDNDGNLDIVYGSKDRIAWYENSGVAALTFSAEQLILNVTNARSIYTVDVNGDNFVDIWSANDGQVILFANNSGSTFTPWDAPYTFTSVSAADLDNDGDIDLLGSSAVDDQVIWYENLGSSYFEGHVAGTGTDPMSLYPADMDNDGDIDILAALSGSDEIVWWENVGGQFSIICQNTIGSTASGVQGIFEGDTDDMLLIEVYHNGRQGDSNIEMLTFELMFDVTAGIPLDSTQANSLIENIFIYKDTNSNLTFESDLDTPVETVSELSLDSSGIQTINVEGSPYVVVGAESEAFFFVVVELTPDAADQNPRQFRITHVSESSSTARDQVSLIPVTLTEVPNFSSDQIIAKNKIDVPTDYLTIQGAINAANKWRSHYCCNGFI